MNECLFNKGNNMFPVMKCLALKITQRVSRLEKKNKLNPKRYLRPDENLNGWLDWGKGDRMLKIQCSLPQEPNECPTDRTHLLIPKIVKVYLTT